MTNIFKPILFSTEMVQAILAGRKKQTRRIVKLDTGQLIADTVEQISSNYFFFKKDNEAVAGRSPKYQIADILWVRETWFSTQFNCKDLLECGVIGHLRFKADNNYDPRKDCVGRSWYPSIHMPKEAARIFLKVTNVRCERLQDISEGDAISEGVKLFDTNLYKDYEDNKYPGLGKARVSFATLWDSINAKKYPWESNPWVWVYDFEQIEKPENFI